MYQLTQHALFNGVSFSLRSRKGDIAVVSFVSTSKDEDISDYLEKLISDLMLLGTHIHSTVNRLTLYGNSDILKKRSVSVKKNACYGFLKVKRQMKSVKYWEFQSVR